MVTIDDYFDILCDDLYRACKTYRLYKLIGDAIDAEQRAAQSRYGVRVCMLYISIEMLLRGDYS